MLPDILFFLKKFITFWLMPLPFCLVLLAAGWWAGRSARRSRLGRGLVASGVLLLLIMSNKFVSTELVRPLEYRYPAIPELRAGETPPAAFAACRYVVVLGGGSGDAPGLPALEKLSSSAVSRISEAVRLLRMLPGARLIVSGPGYPGRLSHAAILAEAAVSLGVAPDRIQLITEARDTEDESIEVKQIVGAEPVALVTSAWHMPRAAGLFRRAGVNALPCPTDYSARPDIDFHWVNLSWDVESLERSTRALHEDLGLLWNWIRSGKKGGAGSI